MHTRPGERRRLPAPPVAWLLLLLLPGAGCRYNDDDTGATDTAATWHDQGAIFVGESKHDYAARALAAGDLNDDGIADLIVSAHLSDVAGLDAGAAYVFYSPVSGERSVADADARLLGEAAGDLAGYTLSAAGDINGDGTVDLLVGAFGSDATGENAGAVYLLLGPIGGDPDLGRADARILGHADGDNLGVWVAVVGDMNDDGMDDLVIGAWLADGVGVGVGVDSGAAYVFEGPMEGDFVADEARAVLDGEQPGDNAGICVDGAGDVNGDGLADVIIGAHLGDGEEVDSGMAYVVLGPARSGSLGDATARLLGEHSGDQAGWAVSGAGDLDSDGYDDLLIGAYGSDNAQIEAGAVYVVHGPVSGDFALSDARAVLTGAEGGNVAGYALDAAGDVDGDGVPDVLVGAYGNDDVGEDAGVVYVVRGPLLGTRSLAADLAWFGEATGDLLGRSVIGAGDADGDGLGDVFIGAQWSDRGAEDAGAAYLVTGLGG